MTLTVVLDSIIAPATPTYTNYFPQNTLFLIFQSDDTGEYAQTGEYIEVACALFSRIQESPLIERLCALFQDDINTIDLIPIPGQLYRNDIFPMRLLINPSSGFHCRIFAVTEGGGSIFASANDNQINQLNNLTNLVEQLENSISNDL